MKTEYGWVCWFICTRLREAFCYKLWTTVWNGWRVEPLLKNDLFTQGLKLKWQEKILQLRCSLMLYIFPEPLKSRSNLLSFTIHQKPVPKINLLIAESHKLHKLLAASNFRGLKCHKCGSTQHLWREYPQHQPSSSTTSSTVTSVSKTAESEENWCDRLLREWTEAEHQWLSHSFNVDQVTGSDRVTGQPVEL